MRIKFCGADRTVTGSQHLLELNGKKILLDCGMAQGKREEAYKTNRHFIFDPSELHSVILSHAHIDHSGNLPTLSAKGFKGDIYCTTATRDLCAIMLLDSAHIQERDTEFVNRKRSKKGEPLFNPLYALADVKNVMRQFKSVSYYKKFYIDGFNEKMAVTFFDAGHILGSAQVLLEIQENGRSFKFGFSGDIGRYNLPILKDPDFIGNINFIISESTYGGRVHADAQGMENQLESAIKEALSRGGKIIVPAFSVGRTQEIVFALSKMFSRNVIPKIPIFVDSPLSTNISDVYRMHHECFDEETSGLISRGIDVFGFSNLTYIENVEESKALNNYEGSCMIISASGMCEAGRILHHLANNIEDEKNTILIVGFMAPDTLGRRLVESKDIEYPKVKIFGDEYRVKAKVIVLNSFSAHADRNELLNYFKKFNKDELEGVFLVHGDPDQQEAFKDTLDNNGFKNILMPEKGTEVEI
jgi:metallo-beta-lactamase family protein